MPREFTPPETCPVCGEAVPRGAKSCPGCGADERAGWDEDAALYDGLDLPEEDFAEDGQPVRQRKPTTPKFWLVVAAVLLVLTIFSSFIH